MKSLSTSLQLSDLTYRFGWPVLAVEQTLRGVCMGPLHFDVHLLKKALENPQIQKNEVSTLSPSLKMRDGRAHVTFVWGFCFLDGAHRNSRLFAT